MSQEAPASPSTDQDHWELFAVVGSGSWSNARYSFTLSEWSAEDDSWYMIFRRPLQAEFKDAEIYSAVADLEHILVSLFINDHVPRNILYFWYRSRDLSDEAKVRLAFMLGQRGRRLHPDRRIATQGISQASFFNMRADHDLDTLPSNESITEWFEFFRNNDSISVSVGLIQNSFAIINKMQGKFRYYDYVELSAALILMVSGLESILLARSEEHADISFKFKTVGTAYYTKYVTDDFFSKFSIHAGKLSVAKVKALLGTLYGLRSGIAHGRSRSIFHGKRVGEYWKPLFGAVHVQWIGPEDKLFFSSILSALGMAQKHIFALIWCSKENLSKGVKIVDELFGGPPSS